jgi:NAD(P)-dependent dehydrogenase (short-subunit alcohol dehydrogenase family)
MPDTQKWTVEDLPELSGKIVIITGANSGLGFEAAREMARKGAHVVLACRDVAKTKAAISSIAAEVPEAALQGMALDLARLSSVREFAESFLSAHGELHVLLNNAGVMAIPYRKTADGFEMQLGTNHLGHFALTGLLLEPLLATPGARVVNVSSNAHRFGKIRFDDLQLERSYGKWRAYGQSKLANLLFTYELQRRLAAKKADVISVGCHPGYAATNLQFVGPRMEGSSLLERGAKLLNDLLSQSAAMGALPLLYAAAAPGVRGGDCIAPDGFAERRGYPKKTRSNARSRDAAVAARLWEASETLTGVHYEALAT